MKKTLSLLASLAAFSISPALAEEKGHKDHKHEKHDEADLKAPNGGRIIHDVSPHVEFFLTKEKKVQITFLDDHGKPVAGKATVSAVAGKRTAPTTFTFEKTATGFLSKEKFPEGKLLPIVLTFKNADGSKKLVKFNVDLADCPTCDFLEYACICDHDHEAHDDHKGHHEHGKKK